MNADRPGASLAQRLGLRGPRRRGPVLARAGLTAGLLTALALWLPLGELAEAAARVGWPRWLALVAAFALAHAVGAVKWGLLLRAARVASRAGAVGRAYAAGLFANLWLPSIVGGDVVRAALLAPHGGVARLATAGLVDRGIDTACLVALAAAGLLLAPTGRGETALRILEVTGAGLALGVLLGPALLWALPAGRLPDPLRLPLERVRRALRTVASRPAHLIAASLLSLALQSGFVVMSHALARAVGVEIGLAAWFGVWPLAKLAGLLPVSLGGLGVRELAHVALLAPFGVGATEAVAQSLVWQTVILAVGALGAGAALWSARGGALAGEELPGLATREPPASP